jgi:hypothetical protein
MARRSRPYYAPAVSTCRLLVRFPEGKHIEIKLAQDREMILISLCENDFWTNVLEADDQALVGRFTRVAAW